MIHQEKEAAVPGITLHLDEQELRHCYGDNYVAAGRLVLRAEVQSFEVWDAVVQRIDGMTVYTAENLAEAIAYAAQRRANRAEQKAAETIEEARQQIEQLEAHLAFMEQEKAHLQGNVAVLQGELAVMKEVVEAQDVALSGRGG